jgi:hypothetical protein
LLDQVFNIFSIIPDIGLNIMRPRPGSYDINSLIVKAEKSATVIDQGGATTLMIESLVYLAPYSLNLSK